VETHEHTKTDPRFEDGASRAARWSMRGTVVGGDRRGRELGFPTANVRLAGRDAPPFGVYAARLDGLPAAVSVGVRPTFGDGLEPLVEAHVLDFSGDLYGREVVIELFEFIRPEEQFDGVAALVHRMHRDIAEVRRLERGESAGPR
jgi:riboflavin kinase/FMN adenylyltransferase